MFVQPLDQVIPHPGNLLVRRHDPGVLQLGGEHRYRERSAGVIAQRTRVGAQAIQVQHTELLRRGRGAVKIENTQRRMHADDDIRVEALNFVHEPLHFGFRCGGRPGIAARVTAGLLGPVRQGTGRPFQGGEIAVEIHAVGVGSGRGAGEQAVGIEAGDHPPFVAAAAVPRQALGPAELDAHGGVFIAVHAAQQQNTCWAFIDGRRPCGGEVTDQNRAMLHRAGAGDAKIHHRAILHGDAAEQVRQRQAALRTIR